MKTKSNNPVLLAHAALIYAKTGDATKARESFLEKVISSNANIPPSLKAEAIAAFEKL